MNTAKLTLRLIKDEVLALQTRLQRLQPLSLMIPMTAAALPYPDALRIIDAHLLEQKERLGNKVETLLTQCEHVGDSTIPQINKAFVSLRLHFNSVLDQIDIFVDVLTQRSEQQHDRWLAGLDIAAADALNTPQQHQPPILLSYLDRGHGAAIRRVKTRLPGGSENPVGMIRIPRERMVGTGIAGSLYHEVGHQAAALLGLLDVLSRSLHNAKRSLPVTAKYWQLWRSEIMADFWAVARLGVTASLGMMSVITLPDAMVYRRLSTDPHPIPWIRVMLNLAIGESLFPDPQWSRLRRCWLTRYPFNRTREPQLYKSLLDEMPAFVRVLRNLPASAEIDTPLLAVRHFKAPSPNRCRAVFAQWQQDLQPMFRANPTYVFCVLGQARADGKVDSHNEAEMLHALLQHWALNGNPIEKAHQRWAA